MTAPTRDDVPRTSAVGASWPRLDSREKVVGSTRYAADVPVPLPGLLHARLVLSPYAHATINRIDTAAALAGARRRRRPHRGRPADQGLRGHADVPAARDARGGLRGAAGGDGRRRERGDGPGRRRRRDRGLHADRSDGRRHQGHGRGCRACPAAQAQSRPRTPARWRRRTPPSATPTKQATASPHAAVGGGVGPSEASPRSCRRTSSASTGTSAVTWRPPLRVPRCRASGTFTTEWVYQAYMEPHGATAWLEGSGELVVAGGMQGIFYTRSQLAKIFGLPISKVRAVGTPLGGAFGSKIMVVEPLAAAAALLLRRPVRLALTRREDMTMTNPAQATRIELEIGADGGRPLHGAALAHGVRLGRLLRVDRREHRRDPHRRAVSLAGVGRQGLRRRDEPRRDGLVSRAGRAAGVVRAREPDRRHRNASSSSTRSRFVVATPWCRATSMVDGEPWVRLGTQEVLDAISEHPLWKGRDSLPEGEGVGLSLGVWPGGKEPAAAMCRLEGDGTVTVITGVVDMSGVGAGFATIAAETLGIHPSRINVVASDTSSAPRSPMSGGSVVTYIVRAGDPALRRGPEDAPPQVRQRGAGDRSGRPRAARRSRRAEGRAGQGRDRSPTSPRSSRASGSPRSRSRATARACRPASRPRCRATWHT